MTKLHAPNVVQPIPLSKRNYLANFLGRAQGKVGRLQLAELAKQYPDKVSFYYQVFVFIYEIYVICFPKMIPDC